MINVVVALLMLVPSALTKKVTVKDVRIYKTLAAARGAKAEGDTLGITIYDWQANRNVGNVIAIDNMGFVHATWMWMPSDSSNRNMVYTYYDGTSWMPFVNTASFYSGYGNLGLLSDGTAFIVQHGNGGTWFTHDAGPGALDFSAEPVPVDTDNYDWIWPRVAYYNSGNNSTDIIYVTLSGYSTSGVGFSKSVDGGATFTPKDTLAITTTDTINDTIIQTLEPDLEHAIAVNPTNPADLAIVYGAELTQIINYSNGSADTLENDVAYLIRSTDNGTTWDTVAVLDWQFFEDHGFGEFLWPYVTKLPYYSPNGNLYVLMDAVDTLARGGIFVYDVANDTLVLVDMGVDSLGPDPNTDYSGYNILNVGSPQMSFDDNGVMYVVYIKFFEGDTAVGTGGEQPSIACGEIMLSYSTDGGHTWSTPENISQTPGVDERYVAVPAYSHGVSNLYIRYMIDVNVGVSVFEQSDASDDPIVVSEYPLVGVSENPHLVNNFIGKNFTIRADGSKYSIAFAEPMTGRVNVRFYNVAGMSVVNENLTVSNAKSVSFESTLPRGLYLVKVSVNGKSIGSQKIIVR